MPKAIAEVQTPGRRRRSELKQAAILDAAEALFTAEGYERVSVDAIAAKAQVSKRTVYDHFGEKETIFLRLVERVHDAVSETVRAAIGEELPTGRDLREALTAFALRVATQAFPSPDYRTFRLLTAKPRPVPRLDEAARDRPERMLEERFAALVADGEIRAADHRVAARHFTALTIGLALDALDDGEPAEPELRTIVSDGVDAFLRAYR